MLEKHSAGDNIASYCTKCKLGLDHVIVAMDGESDRQGKMQDLRQRAQVQGPRGREKAAGCEKKRRRGEGGRNALGKQSGDVQRGKSAPTTWGASSASATS